jgi:hypothetical protein
MLAVFEVDYSIKDVDAFKAAPPELPQYVIAENVGEAVKRASDFETDNVTLLKCNLTTTIGKIAIQKKTKGVEPIKVAAVQETA